MGHTPALKAGLTRLLQPEHTHQSLGEGGALCLKSLFDIVGFEEIGEYED